MAASLFEHGRVRTTEAKAKELRRFVEKLITTARKGTLHARRLVIAELQDRRIFDGEGNDTGQSVVQKLFSEIAPRYAERPGGYTRLIRLAERRIGDAGRQVLVQLVEESSAAGEGEKGGSRRRQRAAKRHEAVSDVPDQKTPAQDEAPADEAQDTPADAGDEAVADEEATDEQAEKE